MLLGAIEEQMSHGAVQAVNDRKAGKSLAPLFGQVVGSVSPCLDIGLSQRKALLNHEMPLHPA